MLMDLRHLLRSLRRSPASAAAAVLTLSLTLGAASSIFALVDAVLLTPPPFPDPDALFIIGETPTKEPGSPPRAVRYDTFESWRERGGSLAAIEAYDATNLTVTGLGAAERVSLTDVTPGFLTVLGITPARGRTFERSDAGRPVVIVRNRYWRTRQASDPDVVGRDVVLGGRGHTIVGVMPERFVFPLNPSDIWRPLPLPSAPVARAAYQVRVIGRLSRILSSRELEVALDDVSRRSAAPADAVVLPMAAAATGDAANTLGLLAAAAGFAVLIAFANLAGLLLVRSIDRRRELAVRTALGARASGIARQLVLEAEALVALGLTGGVLLALWLTPLVSRFALAHFGDLGNAELTVSWRMIAALAILAVVSAAFCGCVPALLASRRSVVDVLRRGVTPAPGELALRRVLVTSEIALACVLLVCLTLVGGSLRSVLANDPGFGPRGVLTLQVSLPPAAYRGGEQIAAFYAALQSALEQRLGHGTVSLVNELPLTGDGGRQPVRLGPNDTPREAVVREAGTAYFDVMRIPIVAGRAFDARDNGAAARRVIVSESLAQRFPDRGELVGHQIRLGGPDAPAAEVIGVVADVKHRALDETPLPTVYLCALQSASRSSILVVRSSRPDADVVAVTREEVTRLNGDVPVYRVRSMPDVIAASPGVPARRVLTATFMGFALLATVLAAIGLFGVVAHDVAARRAELALRVALGADPTRILIRTLGQGAFMIGVGLMIGAALSIWAVRALSGTVVAAARVDPVSVAGAAALLATVGIAAVLPAARRAARTDPLTALRSE